MIFSNDSAVRQRTRCVWAGTATLGAALTFCIAGATIAQENHHMWMTVGGQRFALELEDNPTARAFTQLLPLMLDMRELNGNEKHAALPRKLPTDASRPGTIRTGDVLLYGDDTLVVFYKTFNSSYSYTRIGRIEESAALAQALGSGNLRVAFRVQ